MADNAKYIGAASVLAVASLASVVGLYNSGEQRVPHADEIQIVSTQTRQKTGAERSNSVVIVMDTEVSVHREAHDPGIVLKAGCGTADLVTTNEVSIRKRRHDPGISLSVGAVGTVERVGAADKVVQHWYDDDTAVPGSLIHSLALRAKYKDRLGDDIREETEAYLQALGKESTGEEVQVKFFGGKLLKGWLTDGEIERLRDIDAAELRRRGEIQ